VVLVTH